MPEIAQGVDFKTVAREWRCKWSYDDDMASLKACQKLLEEMKNDILQVIHDWAGKQLKTREVKNGDIDVSRQTVQRFVSQDQDSCDFKVVVKLPLDKFQEWEKKNFEPEGKFLEALQEIPGVSQVETQTYTLECVNLLGNISTAVPKASNGCLADSLPGKV
eukprot:TRINITY_DN7211_c0_g1_i2.p1 TRINITY_DN7211_c0_g1~~TRINITY_DN7211_c0_g1_i2.p1  ORF type:complete len:184 (-),score=42.11 TRINITY_DN7211_c0_g1_i2:32-514(-)